MDKTKLKSLLIPADTRLKTAMQRLDETAEKILFVTNEDKLVGTVTDGDIRRGLLNGFGFNDIIEQLMHRKFIALSCNELDLEKQAERLMIENKIEQIPILDERGTIIDALLWTELFYAEDVKEKIKYKNQIVIMAGGKGTRLDPFTKILPKPLIPIGNKPVIELIMERFYDHGFYKFIYTLNYKKEYLKLFLKDNNTKYDINWVEEDDFLGTAGSLSLLSNEIRDTFFITNCDSLLDVNFEDILKWHKMHDASVTIVGCHNEVKIPFGVLELSNGKLEKISEKPAHDVIINTGLYVMEPHILSYIPVKKPLDMNMLLDLISAKEKVTVYPICDGWLDIGQWDEYKKCIT